MSPYGITRLQWVLNWYPVISPREPYKNLSAEATKCKNDIKFSCIMLQFCINTLSCCFNLLPVELQEARALTSIPIIFKMRPVLRIYPGGPMWNVYEHRPYSRQVTEWMECDVAMHPPPSVYPKVGNGALRGQWAIKYHCRNDSPTIVFTVRELVHWNYVTSENIPRVCKSWKSLLIYVLATKIFCSPDTHSTAINFR